MKSLNIIFLGRSGSGKGTQLNLLKKKFNLEEIDSGFLLRNFIKQKNVLAKKMAEVVKSGHLVPSWLMVYLILQKLLRLNKQKGVIFEGSPRRLEEAKILEECLNLLERDFVVIYLNVSEKEIIRRLSLRRICSKCGQEYSLEFNPNLKRCPKCNGKLIRRPDDNPEAIRNRLNFFTKEVIPVIKYFKKKKLLIEVNGEGTVSEVHQRILNSLNITS